MIYRLFQELAALPWRMNGAYLDDAGVVMGVSKTKKKYLMCQKLWALLPECWTPNTGASFMSK